MEQADERVKDTSRTWWNTNPMVYDWERTLKCEEGTPEYYHEIDRRLHEALPEVHQNGASYSVLLDREVLEGKTVLIIGCGAGVEVEAFARRGALVSAIDFTHRAISLTRMRLAITGLVAELVNGDAEMLPFRENIFDVVWSWGVIDHTPDVRRVAEEIYRVLKPGGKAMIMVYRRDSINYWVGLMLIRGVLMGRLLIMTPQEICNCYSDGCLAKYYSPAMIRNLFPHFSWIEFQGFSQLGGVYPLPRKSRKWVARLMPSALTSWLRRNFGDLLFFEVGK